MSFHLIIARDDLQQWPSGGIAGSIWLESGENAFPERRWSDLSVAVAHAFVDATHRLGTDRIGTRREVSFLDGPFHVSLEKEDADLLRCDTHADGRIPDWSASMPLSVWRDDVWSAVGALVKDCRARGWDSWDLDQLEILLVRPV